ncbi:MAG: copper resistance CopC family protein [Methylocystis sp.]|jgi:methionine-rich copper-binding protein CopC
MNRMSYACAAVVAAGLGFYSAAPVQAHHRFLIESFPASKQVVVKPVRQIKLVFKGKADAVISTITLKARNGLVVAKATQKEASREMVLDTPVLQPGLYEVVYRVLATDGDIVEGSFPFVVEQFLSA